MPCSSSQVLVVDDEPAIHRLLERMLATRGVGAVHANSFAVALDAASRQSVSAIVLDLHLRVAESGLDVLRWLRASPAYGSVPVFVFTGTEVLSEEEEAAVTYYGAEVFFKAGDVKALVDRLPAVSLVRES